MLLPWAARRYIQLVDEHLETSGLDEPGGHYAVVQAIWSGRRVPSTVARGEKAPMNPQETHKDGF